jgi:hypothetical protein
VDGLLNLGKHRVKFFEYSRGKNKQIFFWMV